MVIGDGGAAGHQQLDHGQFAGQRQLFLVQVRPDVVEGGQPGEEFLVQGGE
ncbi:hypothetical protein [Microbulbifer taiwanensis]|uniref:hypothetical protein n=1 Tax=Microbulbifer taiwanensis TaxID=986746 RepID=UPI0036213022